MTITVTNLRNDPGGDKTRFSLASLTDDFVFRVDPRKSYRVEGVVTAAGSAAAVSSMSQATPTDLSEFSVDPSGLSSANFSTDISAGSEWVGAQIDSGTWTITVREV